MDQTIFIHTMNHTGLNTTQYYHLMLGENDRVYWISFSESECQSMSTISKHVRPGKNSFFSFH